MVGTMVTWITQLEETYGVDIHISFYEGGRIWAKYIFSSHGGVKNGFLEEECISPGGKEAYLFRGEWVEGFGWIKGAICGK